MIGKLANVMRCASTFALGGSSVCARESAALTYCNVWNMSTFQSKKRSISAEAWLVMDLTFSIPGTLFTASSRGRVMVTIIWSIGITPLSTAIKIRGKLVAGKTATGTVKARYPPINARVTVRKMTDREWCANQYGDFLSLELTYCFSPCWNPWRKTRKSLRPLRVCRFPSLSLCLFLSLLRRKLWCYPADRRRRRRLHFAPLSIRQEFARSHPALFRPSLPTGGRVDQSQ